MTDHDVTDYDPGVNQILDRQVPLRLDAQSDWAEALRKAGGAPESGRNHRPRGRLGEWVAGRIRSRRLLAPALVAAVLLIAGAAAAGVRLWSERSPYSVIDTTQATSLVEYTLTTDYWTTQGWKAGDRIALWHLPQPNGGTCIMPALASPKPTRSDLVAAGSCGMSDQVPPRKPMWIVWQLGWQGSGGGSLLSGNVSAGNDIARMEIRSDAGSLPLSYSHYWFLGQLPPSSSAPTPSSYYAGPQPGQYILVGYDSQGQVILHRDLRATCCPVGPRTNSAPLTNSAH